MPGRLLGFARSSPPSSTEHVNRIKHKQTSPIAPSGFLPLYTSSPAVERSSMDQPPKRHSLVGYGYKHSDKRSSKSEPPKSASLDILVESPPLVFYNSAQNSTGALFSGQLKLDVSVNTAAFQTLEARLICSVTHKKPVAQHCPDCSTQTTEIKKWDIFKDPRTLARGEYTYPISYLLPGHLPATTHGTIVVLDYYLSAVALTATGETITFSRKIDIKRAIFPSGDKNSTRIFPPTDIIATVTMPQLIHPIGEINVQLRLTGLVQKKTNSTQVRWRLRKLNWQIEEHQKMIAPACSKHIGKVGGEGKGVQYDDTRVLSSEDIRQGWKTDLSEGTVDLEFPVSVNSTLNPICDVDAPNGLSVNHHLIVEMVVSEEWAPVGKLESATPTGSARVLRAQFRLTLTERCGMGISWDEEQPPTYEDVPASPPNYSNIQECNIQELEELDRLSLGS